MTGSMSTFGRWFLDQLSDLNEERQSTRISSSLMKFLVIGAVLKETSLLYTKPLAFDFVRWLGLRRLIVISFVSSPGSHFTPFSPEKSF